MLNCLIKCLTSFTCKFLFQGWILPFNFHPFKMTCCLRSADNMSTQEIIKVREWIPPIGLIPSKVIFRHFTQFFRGCYSCVRGCFRGGFVYPSFRFVSKQTKTSNAVEMSSLIFWFQAKELRFLVCFNTFRNLNRSLNMRQMSPAQTITTEWTAEKCLDKRVQSQQTPKHKLGTRTNRWSKVQADARCPNSKKHFKQQRQQRQRQRRFKKRLIFNRRILREFNFIQFVYTVRNISNRICKTASRFQGEILNIGRRQLHVLSNMHDVTASRCCFVTFCKQRQRYERTLTQLLYSLPLPLNSVYLNFLEPNKWQNNEQRNRHKTNESLAEQKGVRECRKHLWYETKPKHKTQMTFPPFRLR